MSHGDCEICGRQADLFLMASMLDGYSYSICSECLEHAGESWRAIANFLRESKWSDLPSEIESVVTVWQDESYVPVKVGVKRMLERQPVPVEEREADAVHRRYRQRS